MRSSGTTALIANQGQLTTGSVTTAIQQSTGRRRKTKNQSQISAGKSSKFYFKNVLWHLYINSSIIEKHEYKVFFFTVGNGTLTSLVMDQQTIRDGISGQQIILQQPSAGLSNSNNPTIVTTSGNYLTTSIAKRQRLNLGASQASDLVETHHLVVSADNEPVL